MSLVQQARKEEANTMLLDNGDLMQGSLLGSYVAQLDQLTHFGPVHPLFRVMNEMGYDAATFGNHEFNYGLELLDRIVMGAMFPYVNANIYKDEGNGDHEGLQNMYTPYVILTKRCQDNVGNWHDLKIGLIGFVPPQIMNWDQAHLQGRIIVRDMVETARHFIPKMKEAGAELIIAMAHTGFDGGESANGRGAENVVLSLSKEQGIDAITFSHTHHIFPADNLNNLDASFKDREGNLLPYIDLNRGTIHGIPSVQAGYGGAQLGIIDLQLKLQEGGWIIADAHASIRHIYDNKNAEPLVEADRGAVAILKEAHEATITYANQSIGEIDAPIYSYFALVQNDLSVQLVNRAQQEYAQRWISTNMPQYVNFPIISVASPFKAGRNGPSDYSDIPAGKLAIKSATELYPYDNTIKAVKMNKAGIQEWLEMSAGAYNQIDPQSLEEQSLLNATYSIFNFDIMGGVTYQVDVTKPAKYTPNGSINKSDAGRIYNLRYQGEMISSEQEFIVVSSNYRIFGGGNFPGMQDAELIMDSTEENRDILMNYIAAQGQLDAQIEANWSFVPIKGQVNVTFTSSPQAAKYISTPPSVKIQYTGRINSQGYGIFKIDMS